MPVEITTIDARHYPEISKIYLEGISSGNATFQTSAPSWEEWNRSHLEICRLISIDNERVLGWAALSPVSSRCVYAGVAEVSVYVGSQHRGKGAGKALLEELIKQSELNGIWTLQSGIFPENVASIKIHEQCGFRRVGYREKIGKMGKVWRDNLLMERRSKVTGTD